VLIVETRAFMRRVDDLLSREEYRELQVALVQHPTAGSLVPGTGGIRKYRLAGSGRGKRGGFRIMYFWHPPSDQLLMLYVFAKNERADLTSAQTRILRAIVETEYR
jgi:hypothetical protein